MQTLKPTAVIITGYSKISAEVNARNLRIALELKGYNVIIVDPFVEERKSLIFRKTLLTTSSSVNMIEAINKTLRTKGLEGKIVDYIFYYSYGVVGMFQLVCSSENHVFLSPALGLRTIKWRTIEKVFGFLPGFKEMNSELFETRIWNRLKEIKKNKQKIFFFLPHNEENGFSEDERVRYSGKTMEELKNICNPKTITVRFHKDMITSPETINQIFEKLKIE